MLCSKNRDLRSFGNWDLLEKLRSGGFGEVFVWQNHQSGQIIATKRLKYDNTLLPDQKSKLLERWKKEYQWTRNLKCDYIVRGVELLDKEFCTFLENNNCWPEMPVIVMEYCDGGDLRAYLQKADHLNGLCAFDVRKILASLRYAVEYLHDRCSIEHRDLKPDNIVIVGHGEKRIFKLIDFGFARQVMSDHTMQQSHVGTRHYFAPEILKGEYKKSVDYWSIGVIAYEIMSGVLPFIPHQSIQTIYEELFKKDRNCIAISESPVEPKGFTYHNRIPAQNHLSHVFVECMNEWLMLALDSHYKWRGYKSMDNCQGRPVIFTELDEILSKKVLTVFCLNKCEFNAYEITPTLTMEALYEKFGCPSRNGIQIILPIGHPCKKITQETMPIDLYVENWLDTIDPDNPPAMLYLFNQCDYNEFSAPRISSSIIQQCMKLHNDEVAKLPLWYVYQYGLDTHYILSVEQQRLKATMLGLHALTLDIQHNLTYFNILDFLLEGFCLKGKLEQFQEMIDKAERHNAATLINFSEFIKKYKKLSTDMNEIVRSIIEDCKQLMRLHELVYHEVTNLSKNEIFHDFETRDVYQLKVFRKKLMAFRNIEKPMDLFFETETVLKHCLMEHNKLFRNGGDICKLKKIVTDLNMQYYIIQENCSNLNAIFLEKKAEIHIETDDFQKQLALLYANNYVPRDNDRLRNHRIMDCASIKTNHLMCEPTSIVTNTSEIPTGDLINETFTMMKILSSLRFDDAPSPHTTEQ